MTKALERLKVQLEGLGYVETADQFTGFPISRLNMKRGAITIQVINQYMRDSVDVSIRLDEFGVWSRSAFMVCDDTNVAPIMAEAEKAVIMHASKVIAESYMYRFPVTSRILKLLKII